MQTVALSANAVAVLRFEVRGMRAKRKESRLPAYHDLAAAGIMEPVPGSDSTQISPPCHCTMRWQMASPMPVPGISLPCRRLKMPKICV